MNSNSSVIWLQALRFFFFLNAENMMICSLKLLYSRMDGVVVTHPCEVCADLQLRQRLSDVVAQLCGGGV